MRTDFLPRKTSNSALSGSQDNKNNSSNNNSDNNNSNNNINSKNTNNEAIPRSKTCDSRLDKPRTRSTTKKERKRSLPILTTQIKQEVVDQLDGLLGHLETMGEENLVRSP